MTFKDGRDKCALGEIVTRNKEQEAIGQMFDQIAPTYDSVNRLLSFRQDVRWRACVARALPATHNLSVLDVATGTGDLLIELCTRCPNISRAIGIDIAENMLMFGEQKIKNLDVNAQINLQKGDARSLPFDVESFDVLTIAFGIRNVVDIERALDEMYRVLKPGGYLFILEFSLPKNWFFRMVYLCYFRYFLPFVGGIIAKNVRAYRYLNRTVEAFFSVELFFELLKKRGFASVTTQSLSFGIATLYCARKN